jgi:hypothetical protein
MRSRRRSPPSRRRRCRRRHPPLYSAPTAPPATGESTDMTQLVKRAPPLIPQQAGGIIDAERSQDSLTRDCGRSALMLPHNYCEVKGGAHFTNCVILKLKCFFIFWSRGWFGTRKPRLLPSARLGSPYSCCAPAATDPKVNGEHYLCDRV